MYGLKQILPLENSSKSSVLLRHTMYQATPLRPTSASAQRNMYLTGFTLFLSLILTRTFYILLDLVRVQDENAKLKKLVRVYYLRSRIVDIHTSSFVFVRWKCEDCKFFQIYDRVTGAKSPN
jgi:Bap31/Bap29 transmembrane region